MHRRSCNKRGCRRDSQKCGARSKRGTIESQWENRSIIPANEVTKSEEESEDAASGAKEEHGGVAKEHRYEEVKVGGDAEGEVGEDDANGGGVKVLG